MDLWTPLVTFLKHFGTDHPILTAFFNNASVAAFLGAALSGLSSVFVVSVTDRLRDRRLVRAITAEIEIARTQVGAKEEAAISKLKAIAELGRLDASGILHFDVATLQDLKTRVYHRLSTQQRLTLDSMIGRLVAIDELFDEALERTEALREAGPVDATRADKIRRIYDILRDTVVNLRVFAEHADRYLAKDYLAIIQKQLRVDEYRKALPDLPAELNQRLIPPQAAAGPIAPVAVPPPAASTPPEKPPEEPHEKS